MSVFYIVADCPICPGSGELFAVLDKNTNGLLFYCPSCETAWDRIPNRVDEIKSLSFFAPEGVVAAAEQDLVLNGIKKYKASRDYESVEELIG